MKKYLVLNRSGSINFESDDLVLAKNSAEEFCKSTRTPHFIAEVIDTVQIAPTPVKWSKFKSEPSPKESKMTLPILLINTKENKHFVGIHVAGHSPILCPKFKLDVYKKTSGGKEPTKCVVTEDRIGILTIQYFI